MNAIPLGQRSNSLRPRCQGQPSWAALTFVSLEDWDDVWRRNQFVCGELARRHPGLRILFVGLPRNFTNELRRGRIGRLLRRGTYEAGGLANVVVTHPWKLLPDSVGVGRWMNELMFRASVKRVAKRMGIGAEPVLWLNPHYAVHMVGRMGESAVVYDVTDDWTEMTQSPTLARRVDRQDAELCAKADAVIVCSQRLAELKRERSSAVHLIPNGVDAEHYANVLSQVVGEGNGESELPKVAREWRRPVLGYTGTVHPDRVDVELVRKVAQNWEGSVVLVGPDHLRDEDKARIDLPNVHRVGAVKYAEIPGVMRAFDVCMVPHRMTAFTESLNPIKLWEYLAAGKPIVSTDVAGFRDYPKLVRLAKTADEFLAAAHAAVEEGGTEQGKALAEQRRAVARENSWAQRVDEIERVIEAAIERRKLAEGSVPMVGLMKEASQAMHVS